MWWGGQIGPPAAQGGDGRAPPPTEAPDTRASLDDHGGGGRLQILVCREKGWWLSPRPPPSGGGGTHLELGDEVWSNQVQKKQTCNTANQKLTYCAKFSFAAQNLSCICNPFQPILSHFGPHQDKKSFTFQPPKVLIGKVKLRKRGKGSRAGKKLLAG